MQKAAFIHFRYQSKLSSTPTRSTRSTPKRKKEKKNSDLFHPHPNDLIQTLYGILYFHNKHNTHWKRRRKNPNRSFFSHLLCIRYRTSGHPQESEGRQETQTPPHPPPHNTPLPETPPFEMEIFRDLKDGQMFWGPRGLWHARRECCLTSQSHF
ncbi:hypothetical protein CDAR_51321 [Caerostris darwini]|uniref:Uncharacterized protein n=1 Tax=Caerostris darwini TaxID=1538125 RepID=A0AAV4U5Z8_9ARAC|nr:hypothetical protein CDAR_51321 [Caerostris darwini]